MSFNKEKFIENYSKPKNERNERAFPVYTSSSDYRDRHIRWSIAMNSASPIAKVIRWSIIMNSAGPIAKVDATAITKKSPTDN